MSKEMFLLCRLMEQNKSLGGSKHRHFEKKKRNLFLSYLFPFFRLNVARSLQVFPSKNYESLFDDVTADSRGNFRE
jgi:hypothetical protein